jgi:hypothetical protein
MPFSQPVSPSTTQVTPRASRYFDAAPAAAARPLAFVHHAHSREYDKYKHKMALAQFLNSMLSSELLIMPSGDLELLNAQQRRYRIVSLAFAHSRQQQTVRICQANLD